MGSQNTVLVKGEGQVRLELIATAATITPGHLIERASATTVRKHGSAGGNAMKMFAVEDDLQGKDITDVYAASARIQCMLAQRGDIVNALLANGQSAVAGTSYLESAGDGTLRVHAVGSAGVVEAPEAVVGLALETLDLSGSSGVDPASARILTEVI